MPNVLRGVETVDMSVTVLGQKLAMPVCYCSPTALQRLFHHQGERAVAAAAAKYGTMFGVSSLGTVSLEELRKAHNTPQVYQFYFHKDRGLNRAMMQRAKEAGVNVMMLTVDSIHRRQPRNADLRTGFSIPFRLSLGGMMQFALQADVGHRLRHAREVSSCRNWTTTLDMSGGGYVDSAVPCRDARPIDESRDRRRRALVRMWDGQYCIKGVMSIRPRQARHRDRLHGHYPVEPWRPAAGRFTRPHSKSQLAEIVDAVGDRIEVIDWTAESSGERTVLQALSLGAKAVGAGRYYLFPLAAAGQAGCRTSTRAYARGDRARHEADGVPFNR